MATQESQIVALKPAGSLAELDSPFCIRIAYYQEVVVTSLCWLTGPSYCLNAHNAT